MSKLATKFFAVPALLPVLLLSQLQQDTQVGISNRQLNEQSMLAVNWVQQSGEYRALTYQAFNIAKLTFDTAKLKNITRPTIIVDIDETVLDNSPYQAGLLDTNNGFEITTWNQWIKEEKAKAVPGAVEFVNYVNKNGGKVFFISNRDEKSAKDAKSNDLKIATINNLKSVGFTGVNGETVLLKGEFTQKIGDKENTSKQWRVEAVKNGNADGKRYTVIALIGDNLNDFDETIGRNNQQRRDHVDNNRQNYGILHIAKGIVKPAYIAIPNPMYGNWETGMYSPQAFKKQSPFDMTPGERSKQRRESLNRWLGKF
ncbi:MAG: 5'-nucleotidase, lipoprotein e(P4) family [Nostoc sp. NMS1]|uniref:5'-nucleotidase, lipoprotein e(P4) family n=1 Tax=unclassified Nostoc TaxID=2593658 RepID=UPI0025DF7259|nr:MULTISPECIES: 5'-nucleotidase, lipoprotein e(P4) family [unclassified Nostoc]MBN3908285.1 5'-nucleotidase, lipoprotein e(P4) family [Nostoc sp. NMS1]MBN3992424.1 5'-nucleotidase, lipoprotein e(P4) family [Nostoc sp. NMS2]